MIHMNMVCFSRERKKNFISVYFLSIATSSSSTTTSGNREDEDDAEEKLIVQMKDIDMESANGNDREPQHRLVSFF